MAFAVDRAAVAAEKPVMLFNGRDLKGWTYHLDKPDVKMEDVWSVKDGVLRCKGQPVGYLLTKKNDFENYVLELEWRWPEKGGNNGVLVHVTKPGALGVWPKSLGGATWQRRRGRLLGDRHDDRNSTSRRDASRTGGTLT